MSVDLFLSSDILSLQLIDTLSKKHHLMNATVVKLLILFRVYRQHEGKWKIPIISLFLNHFTVIPTLPNIRQFNAVHLDPSRDAIKSVLIKTGCEKVAKTFLPSPLYLHYLCGAIKSCDIAECRANPSTSKRFLPQRNNISFKFFP